MIAEEIKKHYTEPLSLENVRSILKISKKRVAALLQNGDINCTITKRKTMQGVMSRYSVTINDLVEYINNAQLNDRVMEALCKSDTNKSCEEMTPDEIRNNFTDPLSLENIRVILKTSKRRVAWLLQNGYIKCTMKTRETKQGTMNFYSVLIEDLIDYINKVESGELVVAMPSGNFVASEANERISKYAFPKNPPEGLKNYFIKLLSDYENEIPRSNVAEFLGYDDGTISEWASTGKISQHVGNKAIIVENIKTKNMGYITKKSLINYLCDEESGYKALKRNKGNDIFPMDLTSDKLAKYLMDKWKNLEENLPYSVVVEITGYSESNVTRLVSQKKVDGFYAPGVKKAAQKTLSNIIFIDKESLINYLCGEGYSSKQKSKKHNELLKKFFDK